MSNLHPQSSTSSNTGFILRSTLQQSSASSQVLDAPKTDLKDIERASAVEFQNYFPCFENVEGFLGQMQPHDQAIPICAKILPSKVTFFVRYGHTHRVHNEKSNDNLDRGRCKGEIGAASLRKIRVFLEYWFFSTYKKQKRRVRMLTLTVPMQIVDDYDVKRKCLDYFITQLQRKYGVKHYFWKAEAQQRGAIHFHLFIDAYIDKLDVQFTWNKILRMHGMAELDDPSTRIEAINSAQKAAGYAIKYTTKKNTEGKKGARVIEGRVWGCSDGLRKIAAKELTEHNTGWRDFWMAAANCVDSLGVVVTKKHDHTGNTKDFINAMVLNMEDKFYTNKQIFDMVFGNLFKNIYSELYLNSE